MTTCYNVDATTTLYGDVDAGESDTLVTAAQSVRIVELRIVGAPGLTFSVSIGGTTTILPSPVTYEGTVSNLIVRNAAVVATASGSGTGYYTITYEDL